MRELEAARYLLGGGFASQATSSAYYAAFHAAETALASLGQTRSKHPAVVAAFAQFVIKPGGVDPEAGRIFRSLFEGRTGADCDDEDDPTTEVAERAVADAERFVAAVAGWLAR